MRRIILSAIIAAGTSAAQIIIGGGGTGGGGAPGTGGAANYKLAITSTNVTWTVTAAQHLNNHANLLVQCYTAATPAVPLIAVASAPAAGQFAWSVHPTTYLVTITFTAGGNNGGYCVINGSGQGTPGEVTSIAGTYADNAMVLFSGASGDAVKTTTDSGFPFLSAGIYSPVGFTGTGAVVMNISPALTGTTTATGLTVSTTLKVPTFSTGAPALECDAAEEAGNLRLRSSDPLALPAGLRICRQTGPSTWAWMNPAYLTGTTVPSVCVAGDIFVDTDATPAGQQILVCSSTNVWSLAGDGGGGVTTQDEGAGGGSDQTTLNFTGAGVSVTSAGVVTTVDIPGGSGSIASTTSALKGNGSGGAVAVTGTASNCVRVDGTETTCGGSSGGGNPFTMTVNTTADTVTLTATRLVNFLRGRELTTVQSGETFTFDTPTGDGDYIIFYNGGMVISSLALSGVGTATTSSRPVSASANASTGLILPQGAIPLFAGSVASSNFVNTSVNQYAGDSSPYVMDVDASMTMTAVNNYTLRFSAVATALGTASARGGVPPACTAALRGNLWNVESPPGVADILRVCMKRANNSYAWATIPVTP